MNLWSAGAYTLNCYTSSANTIADKYYFLCDDIINDMIVTSSEDEQALVVLACNDSTVKVISDSGKLLYLAALDAAPTSISLVESEEMKTNSPIICYGLNNGNIGAIELENDMALVLWEVDCSSD